MKELVIVINIKQKITAGNIWRKKNALIREDILDEYSKAAAEAKQGKKENFWHFYAIDLAGRAIGVEHLERYDYIGSVLYRERMDREMAERRKKTREGETDGERI